MAVLVLLSVILVRNLKVENPGKKQLALESIITTFNNLFSDVLGEKGKAYIPYLITVILYIGMANIAGIFGFKPPTKDLNVTAALAIMSIVMVQVVCIRSRGPKGWLKSFGMHRGWKHRCIREAEVTRGMKLLDIASGTCDLAIAFAHRTNAENITATDINYEMLSYGRQRLEQLGLNCQVIQADAEHLPFEDNAFDRVTVSFGIRNMTHKDRALAEMLRVLKPGGKLLVLEFSKCAPLLKPFYDFYSFHFMPWLGGKIAGDADSYRYLAESIRMHPDQPTFANLMRSVGFSRVKWHNLTFGVCALHIGIKP